ncbi:TetR/AcrR family transcriptional regulator [Brachybacterium sp. AOP43-C2-M15]|uniref:TetR/AcrR family transcriptional regulator n=1 Tax=Brachybacterium sp. AOP43-C2-M15 TaxID=3457661 RepID=UPI0040345170
MTDEPTPAPRRRRADAQRNENAVREAAKAVFAEVGVDAPMRDIAARAGVGVGTIYRSFPQRSDLIIAVVRQELEAAAEDAVRLAGSYPPPEALRRWTGSLRRFLETKRGIAAALHSGDPAYENLPGQLLVVVAPPVQDILDAGAADGSLRGGIRAGDLIHALLRLSDADRAVERDDADASRMVEVLLDGLAAPSAAHGHGHAAG